MRKRSECAGKLTGQTVPWYLSYGGLSDCVLCFVPLPACHRSCFRCAGRSPHNCTACRLSHVLLDGQCLSQCPDGHFNQEGACTGEYVRGWSTIPMPMFVSIMQPDTVLRHLILGTRVGLYILVLNFQEWREQEKFYSSCKKAQMRWKLRLSFTLWMQWGMNLMVIIVETRSCRFQGIGVGSGVWWDFRCFQPHFPWLQCNRTERPLFFPFDRSVWHDFQWQRF